MVWCSQSKQHHLNVFQKLQVWEKERNLVLAPQNNMCSLYLTCRMLNAYMHVNLFMSTKLQKEDNHSSQITLKFREFRGKMCLRKGVRKETYPMVYSWEDTTALWILKMPSLRLNLDHILDLNHICKINLIFLS